NFTSLPSVEAHVRLVPSHLLCNAQAGRVIDPVGASARVVAASTADGGLVGLGNAQRAHCALVGALGGSLPTRVTSFRRRGPLLTFLDGDEVFGPDRVHAELRVFQKPGLQGNAVVQND